MRQAMSITKLCRGRRLYQAFVAVFAVAFLASCYVAVLHSSAEEELVHGKLEAILHSNDVLQARIRGLEDRDRPGEGMGGSMPSVIVVGERGSKAQNRRSGGGRNGGVVINSSQRQLNGLDDAGEQDDEEEDGGMDDERDSMARSDTVAGGFDHVRRDDGDAGRGAARAAHPTRPAPSQPAVAVDTEEWAQQQAPGAPTLRVPAAPVAAAVRVAARVAAPVAAARAVPAWQPPAQQPSAQQPSAQQQQQQQQQQPPMASAEAMQIDVMPVLEKVLADGKTPSNPAWPEMVTEDGLKASYMCQRYWKSLKKVFSQEWPDNAAWPGGAASVPFVFVEYTASGSLVSYDKPLKSTSAMASVRLPADSPWSDRNANEDDGGGKQANARPRKLLVRPCLSMLVARKYPNATVQVLAMPRQASPISGAAADRSVSRLVTAVREDLGVNNVWTVQMTTLNAVSKHLDRSAQRTAEFMGREIKTIEAEARAQIKKEKKGGRHSRKSKKEEAGGKVTSVVMGGLPHMQMVGDLTDFMDDTILPHEFELRLGQLLLSAAVTLVPNELPDLPFFSYWESLSLLVERASEAVDQCMAGEVISDLGGGGNHWSWNQGNAQKNQVKNGQPLMLVSLCMSALQRNTGDDEGGDGEGSDDDKKKKKKKDAKKEEDGNSAASKRKPNADGGSPSSSGDALVSYDVDLKAALGDGVSVTGLMAAGLIPADRLRVMEGTLSGDVQVKGGGRRRGGRTGGRDAQRGRECCILWGIS